MMNKHYKAAILGAGYISDFHVKALLKQPYTDLVGICDMNLQAAQKLGAQCPQVPLYSDFKEMLEQAKPDVVHILTQPDSHFPLAKMAIDAGCHTVIEKPVTVNAAEAEQLKALAEEKKVSIAINHNFVFSRPFNELMRVTESGELGPLKSVRVVWKKILPQMTFGPWNLWMLKSPGNILFETGSHSLSELLAVIGEPPVIRDVSPRMPKTLPSGSTFFRRWNISAEAGPVAINIETAYDQGYEQHFVEVEGLFGVAKADIENDIFTIEQPTGRAYDAERFHVNFRAGKKRLLQAFRTYGSYAASKFVDSATGAPYETSMLNGIANCYAHLGNMATRQESSIDYAINIAKTAESIISHLSPEDLANKGAPSLITPVSEPVLDAKVLIIGASGFIGKRLLLALQDKGIPTRALVRNASSLTGVTLTDTSEVMVGDFRNQTVIEKALKGVDAVYHLAVAHSNSLEGYLKADSEPTLAFARYCQSQGIKRFIYTGTIDSLNLAEPHAIRESDGVDANLKQRNNYAHSKAITESRLLDLHKSEGFPLVIIRPAIVLGAGGPVNHVGIANWSGLGRCAYWGDGENLLPIVLVDDIVSGLIKALDAEGIEGNTYNLSAKPCISARDYVREVENVLGSSIMATPSSASGHYAGDMLKWGVKVLARHPDKSRRPSLHDWKCREQHASFDTSAAEKDLDWHPTNDRETIVEKGIREPARLFLDA